MAVMQYVDGAWRGIGMFGCKDVNDEQGFVVKDIRDPISRFRIIFRRSTDFFGRITLYNLDIVEI
jgi:hypothetical protein